MSARRQRKFVVPMEVEQGSFEDAWDLDADDTSDLLEATLAEYETEERTFDAPALAGDFRAKLSLEPRPYQQAALERWVEHDGRGVVVLPTGAGKTVVALMAIERTRLRTLVVVPTIELLYQWRDAIVSKLQIPKSKVGLVGDGRKEWRSITVTTYASAAMPTAPIGNTGLLICDEAHRIRLSSVGAALLASRIYLAGGQRKEERA
jgi:superfamily II DNA or RNA helicase